jgi:hypothetical protein
VTDLCDVYREQITTKGERVSSIRVLTVIVNQSPDRSAGQCQCLCPEIWQKRKVNDESIMFATVAYVCA